MQKQEQRERQTNHAGDHESEMERLQTALDGMDIKNGPTYLGLKKQLATHKAAILREQRKREQVVREAARAAAVQKLEADQKTRMENSNNIFD